MNWPHQDYAHAEIWKAIDAGEKRILLSSPTGGGKSRIVSDCIHAARNRHWKCTLYTNRKMLLEQLSRMLSEQDISHGIRAAEKPQEPWHNIQVSSIPTVASRCLRENNPEPLHQSQLVFIDEAHLNKEKQAQRIIDMHIEQGAVIVGVTATPIGLGEVYRKLIVAGNNSELRTCGALLLAHCHGVDEPDAKLLKTKTKTGEYVEGDVVKAIMTPTIFGRVLEWYRILNPEQKPALLFGPGVAESIWFAEQFYKEGISAAHIDGKNIWWDGKTYKNDPDLRQEILDASKVGEIKIVCNRFVMREGIDMPWLYHGILATCFGALQSYLQSVGRIIRAYPGLDHVVIQDHGGNFWRHETPNVDRVWDLECTEKKLSEARQKILTEKPDAEPITCPKCRVQRNGGGVCPKCGHMSTKKSRFVVQENGNLKEIEGPRFTPRKVSTAPDIHKKWESTYWRFLKGGKTFSQAYGYFCKEHGVRPPKTLPLMPVYTTDWDKKIKDVPREKLVQKERTLHASV